MSRYYPFTRAGFTVAQVQDLVSLNTTELTGLNGITPGTVTASKALVVDANKDLSALRNLTLTNLDAGASGTAGTIDVFPTTASKGKFQLAVTDQTGNTTVTMQVGAMGQATAITLSDPGASTASYVLASSTNAGALLGITLGSRTASKAVTLDANDWFNSAKLGGWDYMLAAAGSAFAPSASTEAVMNLGSYAIAANRLQALGCIEFEATALVGAINATDTFTLNVRLGAANDATGTVVATVATDATTIANDYAIVRGKISIRSIVTTTCTVTSVYDSGGLLAGALAGTSLAFVGAFTKDSTAILYLNACGKFSTNSATNSATLQDFKVRITGA